MIEEFNFQSREAPFDPLSAILFKVLQVTAFLFFIAFLALRSRRTRERSTPRPSSSSP